MNRLFSSLRTLVVGGSHNVTQQCFRLLSDAATGASNAAPLVGTVKWFNVIKGYGFITRSDTGRDVFVHANDIRGPNRSLDEGESVEFEIINDFKGDKATNVTGPEGSNVKGSSFRPMNFDNFGRGNSQQGGYQRGGFGYQRGGDQQQSGRFQQPRQSGGYGRPDGGNAGRSEGEM